LRNKIARCSATCGPQAVMETATERASCAKHDLAMLKGSMLLQNVAARTGLLRAAAPKSPSNISCYRRVLASEIEPGETCPNECPFWAEEVGSHACQFQCVAGKDCGALDPEAMVADLHGMYCRACEVPGCEHCSAAGGVDLCSKCRSGYTLSQGQCLSAYRFGWYVLYSVLILILVFLAWWYADLRSKKITNESGLEQGLRFRSRTRLHKPKEAGETRSLWPLTTNLLRERVAGPGLTLFFRFQVAVILWAFLVCVGWLFLSLFVSHDLLILGSRQAITPQQLCTITAWGSGTQHKWMWAKVWFMVAAYFGTFSGSLLLAVFQKRCFVEMESEATMKDFAAVAVNFPVRPGSAEDAEEELRRRLEVATGQEIIGVSICWNFMDNFKEVMQNIEEETEKMQRKRASFSVQPLRLDIVPSSASQDRFVEHGSAPVMAGSTSLPLLVAKKSFHALNATLGFQEETCDGDPVPGARTPTSVIPRKRAVNMLEIHRGLLRGIKTVGKAFIVYRTEASRDKAVEESRKNGGFQLQEGDEGTCPVCILKAVKHEPESVKWANHGIRTPESLLRLVVGVVAIALALCLWTLCCYLPYALYVTSFSYASGEHPGVLATFFFTLLVVVGNQIMYVLCRAVSEMAKFKVQETTEMTYLVLYFLAVLVNLGMDLAVTSYTTYTMMVGRNARTANGQSLEELSVLQIFESYPMQRALGHFLFWYAFPSCFLVPFLLEPVVSIWLPGHVMELLVRSHAQVRGFDAEMRLSYFSPMDLSRYSDILLNATIAEFAFLFPGSYVLKMFAALFAANMYIVLLDHWRVLRAVPGFRFSTDASERCVQGLTAIPVGCLAACLCLKYQALPGHERPRDSQICMSMASAFVVHVVVHWLLLYYLVPLFGRDHERAELTYPEVARSIPCSWFSANPVHCLRSKYLHCDTPPCEFFILGKEHLLKANPRIGVYFEDDAAAVSPRHDIPPQSGSLWSGHR